MDTWKEETSESIGEKSDPSRTIPKLPIVTHEGVGHCTCTKLYITIDINSDITNDNYTNRTEVKNKSCAVQEGTITGVGGFPEYQRDS